MTTHGPTKRSSISGSPAALVALLLAALVIAAVVAVLTLGGSNDDPAAKSELAEMAHIPAEGTVRQTSFAEVASEPLPRHDSSLAQDPAIGQPAPPITASNFDGTEVTIDFADGQPRVLLFLAHWCPHCQDEVGSLRERFDRDGIRSDVEIVAISTSVDEGAPQLPAVSVVSSRRVAASGPT